MVTRRFVKLKKFNDKNPIAKDEITPIHLAARNGHTLVFLMLSEPTDNINPKDVKGVTPFHEAAKGGHWLICQTIIERVVDKTPKCNTYWYDSLTSRC